MVQSKLGISRHMAVSSLSNSSGIADKTSASHRGTSLDRRSAVLRQHGGRGGFVIMYTSVIRVESTTRRMHSVY